jgi:hypothetical protein
VPLESVLTEPKLLHVAPLFVDTWKVTVPVGLGKLPPKLVTCTVSVIEAPSVMLVFDSVVEMLNVAFVVVNISAVA